MNNNHMKTAKIQPPPRIRWSKRDETDLVSIWNGRDPLPGFEDRAGLESSLLTPARIELDRMGYRNR